MKTRIYDDISGKLARAFSRGVGGLFRREMRNWRFHGRMLGCYGFGVFF